MSGAPERETLGTAVRVIKTRVVVGRDGDLLCQQRVACGTLTTKGKEDEGGGEKPVEHGSFPQKVHFFFLKPCV